MKASAGRAGLSRYVETFVRFCDDMIDNGLHVLRAFPDRQLPIRAGAFAHDFFDVCHLGVIDLSEIAFAVGFQSLSQFNRVFKKLSGKSPTAHRANLRRAKTPARSRRR